MWNANGVLIQALNEKTKFIKKICYEGINAYYQYPLIGLRDIESRRLTDEQLYRSVSDGLAVSLEFISNSDLYMRYLNKCKAMQIEVRALFIESAYSDEIWKDELPQMNVMGYEYCSIPIDEQIITDMDWYEPFSKYHNKLNQYGLFDSYEDALEFVQEYNVAMEEGHIGDGEMDAYICRVSEIVL